MTINRDCTNARAKANTPFFHKYAHYNHVSKNLHSNDFILIIKAHDAHFISKKIFSTTDENILYTS